MINLIPNEEKKKTTKEFYLKLVTVSFLMLGICFIVASVLILPSYFLSSAGENFINMKLKSQENEPVLVSQKDALAVVKDLKTKLGLVENAEKRKSDFSEKIINEIILKKIPNIRITKIFYENNLQTGKRISISGVAQSRETLLLFRKALEDDASFSKVDLPISNFVKGSNIEFFMNLIPS